MSEITMPRLSDSMQEGTILRWLKQDGDLVAADDELARRRAAWKPRAEASTGYLRIFLDHVLQANEGVDFDFLRGMRPVRDEDTTRASRL